MSHVTWNKRHRTVTSRQQKFYNIYARYVQRPMLAGVRPVALSRIVANLSAVAMPKPKGLVTKVIASHDTGRPMLTEIRTAASPDHARGTLLYIHGGGFVIGSLAIYQHLVAAIADAAGLRAMFVDYRMAPEHAAPGALDEVTAGFAHLRGLPEGQHIAIAGDSAGGNLALALMHRLKARGLAQPFAAACISPVTDLRGTNPSLTQNAKTEGLLSRKWIRRSAASYLAGQDPATPELSPILGDFTGAPPVLIHVDKGELLFDDARLMADHLRAQGVAVTLTQESGLFHVWHINVGRTPEADASVAQIADFLRHHTPAAPTGAT